MRTKVIQNQNDNSNSQFPHDPVQHDSLATGISFGLEPIQRGTFQIYGYSIIALSSTMYIESLSNIVFDNHLHGIVLQSPSGARFKICVNDNGTLWTAPFQF